MSLKEIISDLFTNIRDIVLTEIEKDNLKRESNFIFAQLSKYKENKNYIQYINFLIEHENELNDIEKYSF